MSPELFDPREFDLKDNRPTKHSDSYAFGMVIYEVLSGKAPFSQCPELIAIAMVIKGERPMRPQGAKGIWLTDDIWRILECCWKPVPGDRPRIKDVLECLEEASRSWTPPSLWAVAGLLDSSGEENTDGGEISSSQVASSESSPKVTKGTKTKTRAKIVLLLTNSQLPVTMLRFVGNLGRAWKVPTDRTRRNLRDLWIG